MAVSEVVDSDDFKTLLRDIYYSEDLKIDSPFANNMKAKLNEICSAGADHNTVAKGGLLEYCLVIWNN